MKILYIALKHEYGDPNKGLSYAYYNGYDALRYMGNEYQVVFFPYDELLYKFGQEKMNEMLLEAVKNENPDLCFFSLFNDEIYKETIKKISDSGKTITFNWFADDKWRFHNFTKHWAPLFNWVSTDQKSSVKDYQKIGYKNVVVGCWGCNQRIFKPLSLEKVYDVSFVGQAYGPRITLVKKLKKAGINIECFGNGWPNGRVSQEKMIEIFSQSKINLNFTERRGVTPLYLSKIFFAKKNGKITLHYPNQWLDNAKSVFAELQNEIKGRNFEIPGCKAFMITGNAENLEDYYVFDKEIVVYENANDLIKKIKYYLNHPEERAKIEEAGYQRTINEYTYEKIFKKIFNQIVPKHGATL